MINIVLDHLERLQSDLAAIDPAHDLAAADRVGDIARNLRDALNGLAKQDGTLSARLTGLRRMDGMASRAA